MATKTICKLSTLALAISAVFTMPVMAKNLDNVDAGQVVDINSSGDYLGDFQKLLACRTGVSANF